MKREVIKNTLIDYIQLDMGMWLDDNLGSSYTGERFIHFGVRVAENDRLWILHRDTEKEEDNPWSDIDGVFELGVYDSSTYTKPEYSSAPFEEFSEKVEEFVEALF